jgi:alanine dehydrogenase
LLIMPAWTVGEYVGVKLVTVVPGNMDRALPSIAGCYILSSARTGEVLAHIDGAALTARRTAAASALASSFLSRFESSRLVLVSTGALALRLAAAHAQVRPITEISVWGRSREKAEATATGIRALGIAAEPCDNLEAAVRKADIISCATLSREPIVHGAWLKAGAHLDLIGAFNPQMRETDDEAVARSSVFVDTRDGALKEAGDLVQAIAAGVFSSAQVKAELRELCCGTHAGRANEQEITLFKSVGASLEDLAAAISVYEILSRTTSRR